MTEVGQQLIKAVRTAAAENPDFVYESPFDDDADDRSYGSCVYIHNGCPSCLIGRGLYEVGLIDLTFEYSTNNHVPFFTVAEALALDMTSDEIKWLRKVQKYQDSHFTWADAVELADEDAKRGPFVRWNVA